MVANQQNTVTRKAHKRQLDSLN